jgi:protein-disulfide isomerase
VKELVRSDGNIRYIIKEYPILGPKSELASRFSIATRLVAGDDAYETMYNGLFVYKGAITSASLMGLANNLGLDGAAISALLNDPKIDQIMGRSVGLGQKLGINGTPTFIMNGQMLRGYVPLEKMRALAKSLRKG